MNLHKVRVKCKGKGYEWLLYASFDRDSGDFIVKTYKPKHKCIRKNKNNLCDAQFIGRIFKEKIVSQLDIRL